MVGVTTSLRLENRARDRREGGRPEPGAFVNVVHEYDLCVASLVILDRPLTPTLTFLLLAPSQRAGIPVHALSRCDEILYFFFNKKTPPLNLSQCALPPARPYEPVLDVCAREA